jgi:hypothetical protein
MKMYEAYVKMITGVTSNKDSKIYFLINTKVHNFEKLIWLSFTLKQCDLFDKFNSGGLHEKRVVATGNLGKHLSVWLKTQETRHAMYLQCNTVARSCNLCCNRKATSIAYYEYAFVALGIQRAMRIGQSHLWSVRLYNIIPSHKRHDFRKKMLMTV